MASHSGSKIQIEPGLLHWHIESFGGADLGHLHLTLDASNKVVKAEARIYDSPSMKRMVIDDPDLLRMFGDGGDTMNLQVFGDPYPRFKLIPLKTFPPYVANYDERQWKVVRLAHASETFRNRGGWRQTGVLSLDEAEKVMAMPQHARDKILKTYPRPIPLPMGSSGPTIRPATNTSVPLQIQLGQASRKPAGNIDSSREQPQVDAAVIHPNAHPPIPTKLLHRTVSEEQDPSPRLDVPPDTLTTRQPKNRASAQAEDESSPQRKQKSSQDPVQSSQPSQLQWPDSIVPGGYAKPKVESILEDMAPLLPNEVDRQQYMQYVTTRRKEASRSAALRRVFHRELEVFVRAHNIVDLHNQYARWRRMGPGNIYNMPKLD